MQNEITITAEQIARILAYHKTADKRYERAHAEGNRHERKYAAEAIAIERVMEIIGIEY